MALSRISHWFSPSILPSHFPFFPVFSLSQSFSLQFTQSSGENPLFPSCYSPTGPFLPCFRKPHWPIFEKGLIMPSGVKKRKAARKKKEKEAKIDKSSNTLSCIYDCCSSCCCLGFSFSVWSSGIYLQLATSFHSSICRLHSVCFSLVYLVWNHGSFIIRLYWFPLVDSLRSSCSSSLKMIRSLLVGHAVNAISLFGFTFNAWGFG